MTHLQTWLTIKDYENISEYFIHNILSPVLLAVVHFLPFSLRLLATSACFSFFFLSSIKKPYWYTASDVLL